MCLSLHARPYDPLGFILPVKMIGNLLFRRTLQSLSEKVKQLDIESRPKSKLPWDLEVDGFLRDKWITYFEMLNALKDINFARSLKPVNVDETINPCICTFSDGSEDAYGAVAYVLWTLKDGSREARFIMAKAKLGPLLSKGETVKNELSGAVFAVRLKTWILKNTCLQYQDYYPFLDSRIVQSWSKSQGNCSKIRCSILDAHPKQR